MYVCTYIHMYKYICITEKKVLFHVMSSNIFSIVVPPHLNWFPGSTNRAGSAVWTILLYVDWLSPNLLLAGFLLFMSHLKRYLWETFLTKPSFSPVPSPTIKALNSWDYLFCIFPCFIFTCVTSCLSPLKCKLNSQHLEQWLAQSRHSLNFCWIRFYCVRE